MPWSLPLPPKLLLTVPVAHEKLSSGVMVGGCRQAGSVFGFGLAGKGQMVLARPDRKATP